MDLRIISPAQDDLRNALSEDRDYFHDHEVIHGLKDQSFDIRPSEAAKFSPGAECTSTGGSNSEYQDDPIVIVGMGKADSQSHDAVAAFAIFHHIFSPRINEVLT